MKKFLSILALSLIAISSFGWGRNGHDAIAYIADCNLTPKAKEAISYYLDGKSVVYYASWMDEMRHLEPYNGKLEGHSFAVDENLELRLLENPVNDLPGGFDDGLYQYIKLVESLSGGKYKDMSKEDVAFAIKVIVHLVGDYHQPMHVRYLGVESSYRGYQSVFVNFRGQKLRYHKFWDNDSITGVHKWNFMEYGYVLGCLNEDQVKEITEGDIKDWCRETARLCRPIHDWVKEGDNITNALLYNMVVPLAESQIQKAGYRLAKVLNEIFG